MVIKPTSCALNGFISHFPANLKYSGIHIIEVKRDAKQSFMTFLLVKKKSLQFSQDDTIFEQKRVCLIVSDVFNYTVKMVGLT